MITDWPALRDDQLGHAIEVGVDGQDAVDRQALLPTGSRSAASWAAMRCSSVASRMCER